MDSFEKIGYEIRENKENEIIYDRLLGDTEFIIVLNKKDGDIVKYANDFRKMVEVLPDKEDISALNMYIEGK